MIDVGSFQRGGRVGSTWKFPALPASSEVTPRRPKSRSQEGTQPPSPPLGSPMRPGGPHTWGHPLGKWLLTRSMGLAGPRHGSSHLTIQGGVSWAPTQHQVLHWVLDGGGGGAWSSGQPTATTTGLASKCADSAPQPHPAPIHPEGPASRKPVPCPQAHLHGTWGTGPASSAPRFPCLGHSDPGASVARDKAAHPSPA